MRWNPFALMGALIVLALTACSTPQPASQLMNTTSSQALPVEEQRQAILSMVGSFDVTFHFEETVAIAPDYTLTEPYTAHAIEKVFVLEDTPQKISLQHLLIANGHVVKHWRQDWEYEQTQFWAYLGDYTWGKRNISAAQAQGKWVQTVWQVDDSPRYAGIGKWQKTHGVVSWESDESWRPLPRREHTERQDYDVLVTKNRHVITPNGWVHEQDSQKLQSASDTVVAKEMGVNSYERNPNLDFAEADQYWQETRAYWQAVRAVWAPLMEQDTVALTWPGDNKRAHFSAITRDALNQTESPQAPAALEAAAEAALSPFLLDAKKAKGQLSALAP